MDRFIRTPATLLEQYIPLSYWYVCSSCTEREMKAVHSEHQKNLQSDGFRYVERILCVYSILSFRLMDSF